MMKEARLVCLLPILRSAKGEFVDEAIKACEELGFQGQRLC